MKAQRLDLAISGMHCAGCVARVEKVLRSLPGVQEAQVNLATETATLHYESDTVRLDQVVAADVDLAAALDADGPFPIAL